MSQGTVFIVDDNAKNLGLLSRILGEAGYEVRAANNGPRALHAIERALPELVMLDIEMPEMDGYEVCRRLKAIDATASIPVIFISARDDVASKVDAFRMGGVDYVTKPFEEGEVLARVESQLKISRLQRELVKRNAELQRMYDQLLRSERKTERVFSALSDALPGTVLDDTYRLDAKIGEGGFGAVFRATHLGLDRPVAVKVLRPTAACDAPGAIARFKIEGIAACRVVHPNAVEVLDSGIGAGSMPYLVMELLRGYTLAWTLKVKGHLPLAVAAPILRDVCGVLAEAHALGIVHRDIKPDNVFLHQTKHGEVVKVVDFGIAKLVDDEDLPELEGLTVAGVVVGTPDYVASERVLGEKYDGKVDVFSVAVMAYLMLSGKLPFGHHQARSAAAAAVLRLTAKPKPLGDLAPDLPESVERVVMRSLSNEPGDRATAREFGEAFAAALGR